ncbi:fasciclin domain-containing protein [Eleftheria terrae]|uniref:fasciclin domain-containing protein n=1 Tax=Eleftheria terrae TaxID=1597781 RepID=UPI00263B660B|nr:fasciclin domain-containing protein [Eleftheria terrae]
MVLPALTEGSFQRKHLSSSLFFPSRDKTLPPIAAATDDSASDLLAHVRRSHLLQLFAALLQPTQLAATLASPGPFTLFAPCNAAFAALPREFLRAMMADPRMAAAILSHHVSPDVLQAGDLGRCRVRTLRGDRVCTFAESSGPRYGAGRITAPSVNARNGVLHILSEVIIPEGLGLHRRSAGKPAAVAHA